MFVLPHDTSGVLWRKSTRSQDQGACVELGKLPDAVAVRDSKNPATPALVLHRKALSRLAAGVKAGHLDI
jgi:hypothetical protein